MTAQFNSTCPTCRRTIHKGDDIEQRRPGERYSHTQCPVTPPIDVKIEGGSIKPKTFTEAFKLATKQDHLSWREVPKVPEELFNIKGMHIDADGTIKKVDPSTSVDDLMAYDRQLRQETGSGIWDSELMMHQFYDENPWLDKIEAMSTIYGKAATIPMKTQNSTDREKRIQELREEADRLERDERRRRKQAKKNAKAAKVERRRTEVAKATLEAIAADKKARKEDRVEAARVLLGRDY